MSTKSISTLEARLTVAEATIKLLQEQLAEMAEMKSGGSSGAVVEKKQKEKKKRDPDAPKSPWENMIPKVSSMLDKDTKEKLKAISFNHMKVAGYLKSKITEKLAQSHVDEISQKLTQSHVDEISQSDVDAAVEYLLAHPDFKSKTDEIRSEKGSVTSGDEKPEKEKTKRGRPPKEKADKAAEKKIEVVSASDASDGDNETAEEWEFAGEQFYKLTKSNAIIDMDFEYIGIFDGKKIDRKAEMPASVKKYLEQFD
jgi:hypothetical protein